MLTAVQLLRAIAATMVVWHHARHEAGLLAARGAGAALAPATLVPWWAGVDLFFVISGLVIVLASRRLAGRPGGRRLFLSHRIARVVPLYWLTSLAYLALALVAPGLLGEAGGLARDPGYVAGSFLFWPMARPDGSVQPLYGLGWTLNYEMAFYALFAVGLGAGLRLSVLWLTGALAVLVAGGLREGLPLPVSFWADPIVLEFALGAGLGLARAEGLCLSAAVRVILAAAGFGGLLWAGWLLGGTGEVPGFTRPLLVGLPAVLLVAAAAFGPSADRTTGDGPSGRGTPWVALGVALGDASYALYLVHPFALRAGREGLVRLGLAPALHPWGSLIVMTGLALAAAWGVHRFVERPLTRRLRRWLDARENRVGVRLRPISSGGEDG